MTYNMQIPGFDPFESQKNLEKALPRQPSSRKKLLLIVSLIGAVLFAAIVSVILIWSNGEQGDDAEETAGRSNDRAEFVQHPVAENLNTTYALLCDQSRSNGDNGTTTCKSSISSACEFLKIHIRPGDDFIVASLPSGEGPVRWEHFTSFDNDPVTAKKQLEDLTSNLMKWRPMPTGSKINKTLAEIFNRVELSHKKDRRVEILLTGDGQAETQEGATVASETLDKLSLSDRKRVKFIIIGNQNSKQNWKNTLGFLGSANLGIYPPS